MNDLDAEGFRRFAVIKYSASERKIVFSARRHDNEATHFICQLQQQGLFKLY